MPRALQLRIERFYEYRHDIGYDADTSSALAAQLPTPLRVELDVNIKRQLLAEVAMFRQCMPAAVLDVMQRLQSQIAVDRQVL